MFPFLSVEEDNDMDDLVMLKRKLLFWQDLRDLQDAPPLSQLSPQLSRHGLPHHRLTRSARTHAGTPAPRPARTHALHTLAAEAPL